MLKSNNKRKNQLKKIKHFRYKIYDKKLTQTVILVTIFKDDDEI